jgi:Resolvase, N terminal domain
MNLKALLYCSIWPDEKTALPLENQSVELQTYCLMQGIEVEDIIFDVGAEVSGRLRNGMERLLTRVMEEGIGHIIIHDIGRIGRERNEILAFLRDTFDAKHTVIHITSWKINSASADFLKLLSMAVELANFDSNDLLKSSDEKLAFPSKSSSAELPFTQADKADVTSHTEKLRLKPLWSKIFAMLQDERYAEVLIKALFQLRESVQLSEPEYQAVHGGYDHLNMFRALGFRIKGERTDNTRRVADVLVRYWDMVKTQLGPDVQKIIEGSETSAFL